MTDSKPKKDKHRRHPWDWYVEQEWVTARFLDFAPIETGVVMLDPCCGSGNVVRALRAAGNAAFGSDLFDRGSPHFLGTHDFLGDQRSIFEGMGDRSIFFNSPFSYQDDQLVPGLAEKYVMRALDAVTHQVGALLPLKWLSSTGRYKLFTDPATAPVGVWILTERPSMPPGDQIEKLGKKAWARGKIDYMWVLWDKRRQPSVDQNGIPFVPTYWIPPREKKKAAADREGSAQSEMVLTIPVNGVYFDQIASGEKTFEFRPANNFWEKRLLGREYDRIVLTRGYPKGGGVEGETRLTRPYRGYDSRTITHPHFGPDPVDVFAIKVSAA